MCITLVLVAHHKQKNKTTVFLSCNYSKTFLIIHHDHNHFCFFCLFGAVLAGFLALFLDAGGAGVDELNILTDDTGVALSPSTLFDIAVSSLLLLYLELLLFPLVAVCENIWSIFGCACDIINNNQCRSLTTYR